MASMDGQGQDTEALYTEEVAHRASILAAHPCIRDALLSYQRYFASSGRAVLDGRDVGSVVVPTAQLKLFVVSTLHERARRRYQQQGPGVAEMGRVLEQMADRDRRDRQRSHAPLMVSSGAVIVDTTGTTVDQCLLALWELVDNVLPVQNRV